MSQVPEESYTQAQFRQTFKNNRQFVNLLVLGSDSSGTHVSWEDSRGERHFGVISDLISYSIVRVGRDDVTVGTPLSVSFSALSGSVADYRPFASAALDEATSVWGAAGARLESLNAIQLNVNMDGAFWQTSSSASHAHGTHAAHTPTTHSSIDVTITNPHTHDNHTLTHAAHTGGAHRHDFAFDLLGGGLGAPPVIPVSWMIIRIAS